MLRIDEIQIEETVTAKTANQSDPVKDKFDSKSPMIDRTDVEEVSDKVTSLSESSLVQSEII